jgi:tetratricopeptide (TPR) repeat protein
MHYHRFTAALTYLKEALELEPTHGYPWFELGNCQAALAFVTPARTSHQRCLELRPDYAPARVALKRLADNGTQGWLRRVWRRWR